MKNMYRLSLILISIIFLNSCKKDEVTPGTGSSTPTLAETHYNFNIVSDGQAYSATDGIGGYENFGFSYDIASGSDIEWLNMSMFISGDSTKPLFAIYRSIIKPSNQQLTVDDLRTLFSPGSHNYGTDPTGGIVVAYSENNYNTDQSYNSEAVDQTGSTFVITDTLSEKEAVQTNFKFKAHFNCKLANLNGDQKTISSGSVVCKFSILD